MGAGVLQQKVPVWHRVLFDGIYGLCWVVPNLASRKVGTPCAAGDRRTAAPWAFMDLTATLLSSAAQRAWEESTEDLEPWRTSLSGSFPALVASKYRQTWAALPQHPWKHILVSIAHPERHSLLPQELPCLTQCQAEHHAGLHEMQCWAASCPEHGQQTLLSAPTCPNRS